ncbi:MAG: ABC transporter ATP-binding protein [Clostridiales bacterium]|nr:ABC transporter ATP-binding protein [Clostridiales bacterium]
MLMYDDITVMIKDKTILNNISATFPYGTITCILGPNGCGKSTMLQALFSPKLIKGGKIYLDDKPLFEYPAREKAKRIAYLPQLHEIPPISVRTLITQGRFPYTGMLGRANRLDEIFIERSLNDINMTEFANRNLTTLSGGECKRAYLGMILAQNTDYIILDEPTTFLDIKHRLELIELLSSLRDRGKTIVAVLHDINEVLQLADIILLMKDGCLIKTLSRMEFLNSDIVKDIFQVQMTYEEVNNHVLTNFSLTAPSDHSERQNDYDTNRQ